MANRKTKLTYFDAAGRAEILRLLLTYAGKEFEDNRISRDKWPEIKPTTPFGQVPVVEIDGKVFGQTVAIANFFASEFGLYGKTNLDRLRIDQLVQLIEDFVQEVGKVYREPDEAKKAELEKKVKEEAAPKYLGFIEKMLNENKGQRLLGDSDTYGDIVIYDLVTGFLGPYTATAVEQSPLVKALAERIGNNDRIKAYKAKHN
ncbi:unnamed protein product [Candidula unifasciata]|uniref:Glutathione S-transferase n=1 Tax=Candidula unifasciata TaxID=100452 RepID=A0A8S3ZNE7_9EUPU|nr:unnamed protein product [Candidula unifasciata]